MIIEVGDEVLKPGQSLLVQVIDEDLSKCHEVFKYTVPKDEKGYSEIKIKHIELLKPKRLGE